MYRNQKSSRYPLPKTKTKRKTKRGGGKTLGRSATGESGRSPNDLYIEVYFGITFYDAPKFAVEFGMVDEAKRLQDKYKTYISQLTYPTEQNRTKNGIEIRLGETSFEKKLESLDDTICQSVQFEGNFAKKEIAGIIGYMSNKHSVRNHICFVLCTNAGNIIGICNISLAMFDDDDDSEPNNIYIDYLCGSNYKYSGTVLLNVVKSLMYIGCFSQIDLISYQKSVGFYRKHEFTQTLSDMNTPKMTFYNTTIQV
jgi:hypothetical protein